MTPDQRAAREAYEKDTGPCSWRETYERGFLAGSARGREESAKLCDAREKLWHAEPNNTPLVDGCYREAKNLAALIRSGAD